LKYHLHSTSELSCALFVVAREDLVYVGLFEDHSSGRWFLEEQNDFTGRRFSASTLTDKAKSLSSRYGKTYVIDGMYLADRFSSKYAAFDYVEMFD
jgi:hypothetical protein